MMNQCIATFGGGCFWCIDAAFRRVKGVTHVASGYAGGHTDDPSYEQICTGQSGHAEVVQISFDPQQIDFSALLAMFFALHDPTQLNRQGNDIGTQYRSVVFYHSEEQRALTQHHIEQLTPTLNAPIVTEVTAHTHFYPAEQYHQDYYTNNPNQGYCSVMIAPKLAAFAEKFAEHLNS
ncbi:MULTISPECIES: peptide-methionine (S)-S-oxide reductase MsrA [Pseudoalteromonas]|uniref:Peptide methionine sulfoxide reductase MsrA n=1 Tax=Pseudoalteromonas rubra TaxID=43658 RepID=A0A5S3V2T1_9GAMM|nr:MULTISPECIES: peptide-methionine (S)-S-oxide reductase MsrA [Pseudoalteromonas]MCG7561977.1 peptide-methionine (S)-S-oxide reductase MsrA [Pseudoalteromonas sp. McH1-42]QPB81940.1 peptide-methionine (S)-S-oxide reductase MsrA [Pseudoalteromonas rubra]